MKKKRGWLAVLILVVIVGAGIVAAKQIGASRQQGYAVETQIVQPVTFVSNVAADGVVAPLDENEVRSPINARLTKVEVQEGQRITKGTTIAWLSSQERLAEVEAARADLEDARINQQSAMKNLSRVKKLYDVGGATKREVDDATDKLNSARGRYTAAQKRYNSIMGIGEDAKPLAEVKDTQVVSLVDGVVTRVNISDGQVLTAGMSMINVSDIQKLIIKAKIGEADAAMVQAGQPVKITTDALPGREIKGVVTKIAPEAVMEGNVAKFPVDITLLEGVTGLKSGMSADVEIVVYQAENALSVPFQAVVEKEVNGKITQVVYVVKNGQAWGMPVKTGKSNTADTEILDGLKQGDVIVIGDFQTLKKLKNGDQVHSLNAPAKAPAKKKTGR